jgi:methylated-DNA-[protein]-cysteine S-methyltransferase
MSPSIYWTLHPSPIGDLLLTSDGQALTRLYMEPLGGGGHAPGNGWVRAEAPFATARAQLDGYFAGTRRAFDLPIAPAGSDFQRRVWSALTTIPYGSVTSYGRLAAAIGRPTAARAVGLANGRNPISIVLPCHRVVGAGGALVGYGGGLERKRFLLALEGAVPPPGPQLFPMPPGTIQSTVH